MAVHNVRDLLIDRYGVPLTSRRDVTTAGGVVPGTEILKGNPARVGFSLVNGSDQFIAWAYPLRLAATGQGFRLEPDGGALFADWQEDGELVALPWFVLGQGGSVAIRSLEILIDAKAPRSPRED